MTALFTIAIAILGAAIITAILYAFDLLKRAAHGDTEL